MTESTTERKPAPLEQTEVYQINDWLWSKLAERGVDTNDESLDDAVNDATHTISDELAALYARAEETAASIADQKETP